MSVDLAWYLAETALALVDVRVALTDVAARHPGVVVRRELNVGAIEEVPREDIDAWDEGIAFFKIGFPSARGPGESGEADGPPSSGGGLDWGDILFSRGSGDDEGGEDDGETGASILISSKLSGAPHLWPTLSAFAGEAAAELGARSQEDVDAGTPAPEERPFTWAQVRMWIRGEDVEITAEDTEHMTVVFHLEDDDSSQRVTLARETHLGRPCLRVSRVVDGDDQVPSGEALVQSEKLLSSTARSEEDGLVHLVQRIPFTAVTKSFLDALVRDLGGEAEPLESKIRLGLGVC